MMLPTHPHSPRSHVGHNVDRWTQRKLHCPRCDQRGYRITSSFDIQNSRFEIPLSAHVLTNVATRGR